METNITLIIASKQQAMQRNGEWLAMTMTITTLSLSLSPSHFIGIIKTKQLNTCTDSFGKHYQLN